MTIYQGGNVLYRDKVEVLDIAVDNDIIVAIGKDLTDSGDVVDCRGKYILPSLIDIHTHGAVGYDFNTATLAEMESIIEYYLKCGVGGVLPTIMTDSLDRMITQCQHVVTLSAKYKEILGINLEGPFLSVSHKGAMPQQYILSHDRETFDQLFNACQGMLKMMTISPEGQGGLDLIRYAVSKGVVVSLGHSNASCELTLEAVKVGAKCFTHTYNAMSPLMHRQPNMVGVALTSDAWCEVIADGIHVHPTAVKLLSQCKGEDKVILVTDSIMATGLKDGQYTLAGQAVEVASGKATLLGTNTLAGSTLTATLALANYIEYTNTPMNIAIKAMTINPARLLSMADKIGSIEVGKYANIMIIGE